MAYNIWSKVNVYSPWGLKVFFYFLSLVGRSSIFWRSVRRRSVAVAQTTSHELSLGHIRWLRKGLNKFRWIQVLIPKTRFLQNLQSFHCTKMYLGGFHGYGVWLMVRALEAVDAMSDGVEREGCVRLHTDLRRSK